MTKTIDKQKLNKTILGRTEVPKNKETLTKRQYTLSKLTPGIYFVVDYQIQVLESYYSEFEVIPKYGAEKTIFIIPAKKPDEISLRNFAQRQENRLSTSDKFKGYRAVLEHSGRIIGHINMTLESFKVTEYYLLNR